MVAIIGGLLMGGGVWLAIRGFTRRHGPPLGAAGTSGRPVGLVKPGVSGKPGGLGKPGVSGSASVAGLAGVSGQAGAMGKAGTSQSLRGRAMVWSENAVQTLGTDFTKLQQALRICAMSKAEHAYAKVSAAVLWGFLPAVFVVGGNFVGLGLPVWVSLVGVLLGAPVGFAMADRQLQDRAAKRQSDFRGALVAYLDLVKILLAGGSHTDGALYQAALVGKGWAFSEIRGVLDWSRVHGQPLSFGLLRLGRELGVVELNEIASTVSLAETEGASPSEALARKAEAAADRALTEAQAEANALTEKMTVPTVLIAFAFVVFIAYPALSSLSSAL